MTKIKIKSNPYERNIEFLSCKDSSEEWKDIRDLNANSRLREIESVRSFLPFKIKEIIDIILDEYQTSNEKITIVFEGTQEEYEELEKICHLPENTEKIELIKGKKLLENAKLILTDTKEIFKAVHPIIQKIVKDDDGVTDDLNKITDALDDIIPICVFGNYSAGKSTFINSLIGHEILPSGGDPVTAKIYKISISDSEDFARIKFKHWGEDVELLYEGKSFRIRKGGSEDVMLSELTELMKDNENDSMYCRINKALAFINGYERIDMDTIEISDVIEVEVPFAKDGVLGRSRNNFVIFDTPGSNSNSNVDHSKVLSDALHGFSNGIPIWISQYETIDSNDNAQLCDDVLGIKALDKRFTMIILNKADCSDLPENGFSAKQIKNILEYNSVEKMYASGVYFVSSVMGLGAKNDGNLTDKHYRKIYRSQQEIYSDPEDEDYATLYIYNIMPEQIKNELVEYSKACSQTESDTIYANSGLFCIEQEMEDFASKYSAYNKCQMVYMFLQDVIHKTHTIIQDKTDFLTRTRETRRNELGVEKQKLIDTLTTTTNEMEEGFYGDSKDFVKTYVSNLDYSYNPEELAELDEAIAKHNEEINDFGTQKNDYIEAKNSFWSNLKKNGQSLLKGNIKENIIAMKDDFVKDYKEIQENKDEMESSRTEIDKATSDEIMKIVVDRYQRSIIDAKEKASSVTKQHWIDYAETLKNSLIAIITGSDALSSKQRDTISEIIINHQGLLIDDEANTVFVKAKYLKGQFFGLRFGSSERLNTKRLANNFNDTVAKMIKEMTFDLNENCYSAYKIWQANLCSAIEENITELNPQLKQIAELIKEETEKINELAENQQTICSSLEAVKKLMAWKDFE